MKTMQIIVQKGMLELYVKIVITLAAIGKIKVSVDQQICNVMTAMIQNQSI
jgi:hypothetical protein